MDDLTFVGNATTLIRLGTFTLLTDPNFLHRGQRAYLGKGLWSRRLTDPALEPEQLPTCDAVVLSHLHGDHFDRVARRRLTRTAPVVTTPEAAGRLERWGFRTDPLATWETHEQTRGSERLTIQAMPGIHARGMLRALLPPVMGSWIEHSVDGAVRRRLYISGDTLTGDHVDAVRKRHGSPDVAIVHLGGTRVLFSTVTMDAAQGTDFVHRSRPRAVVPIHYDDYRIFKSPISDFERSAAAAGFGDRVTVPRRGQTIELGAAAGAA